MSCNTKKDTETPPTGFFDGDVPEEGPERTRTPFCKALSDTRPGRAVKTSPGTDRVGPSLGQELTEDDFSAVWRNDNEFLTTVVFGHQAGLDLCAARPDLIEQP